MRKKFKFKIENRDFIILEPTVEQYWLSLYDFSEFLNETSLSELLKSKYNRRTK